MKKHITFKNVLILVLSIACLILLFTFFRGCKKTPTPPNQKLIEHLEKVRKSYDTLEAKLEQWRNEDLQRIAEREYRDSITHLAEQTRLLNSIKSIKTQYGKIPSYSGISNDSLRRILRERFGN